MIPLAAASPGGAVKPAALLYVEALEVLGEYFRKGVLAAERCRVGSGQRSLFTAGLCKCRRLRAGGRVGRTRRAPQSGATGS